jgi:hypothetical protein
MVEIRVGGYYMLKQVLNWTATSFYSYKPFDRGHCTMIISRAHLTRWSVCLIRPPCIQLIKFSMIELFMREKNPKSSYFVLCINQTFQDTGE